MEAGICPWTPFDTTSHWAVPQMPSVTMTTPSVGTVYPDFAVSWPAVQSSPACSWGCTSWSAWSGVGVWNVAELAPVSALMVVGAALEAALQALVAFVYNEIKTLISDAVSPIQIALSNVFSNVLQTINTMLIAVENNQPMTETEAAPSWEEAVLPFLIGVTIATMAMVALTVVQDVSLGAGFLVGILGTVIVGTAPPILALSNSLMSQLLSGGSAAILAMMGFVNSTASAEHNGPLFVSPSQGDAGSCYHTVKAFADGFGGQSKKTIIHPRNS